MCKTFSTEFFCRASWTIMPYVANVSPMFPAGLVLSDDFHNLVIFHNFCGKFLGGVGKQFPQLVDFKTYDLNHRLTIVQLDP